LRILFLSQWFQPEPIFKGLPLARALRDRGHEVEVLTGFPNYPGGKVYPGYRIRLWQNETMDGIRLHRVALYPSHDRSGLRRTLNYLSFGLSAASVGNLLVRDRPDVVYAFNLVTLGLAAGLLRLRFGCPVVYDISDLWPESVADSGMLDVPFLLAALDRWSRAVYGKAAHLIAISPGMKRELVRRGADESRVSVVYNWCDEEHMRPAPRDECLAEHYGFRGRFVAMFAGAMGVMQKLDAVLDAAEILERTAPRILFALIGGGVDRDRLRRAASERRLSNVAFIDQQPAENMGRILALADAALVLLKDSPSLRLAIPSKIQAYMAAGKPIVAAIRGDAEDILRDSGAGRIVEPETPGALADALAELARLPESERRAMGLRGRDFYLSKMSMDAGVVAMEKIFRQVAS
jgi:glycosyltransferase involved in cell wall biosynthesis